MTEFFLGLAVGLATLFFSGFVRAAGSDLYNWVKRKVKPPPPEPAAPFFVDRKWRGTPDLKKRSDEIAALGIESAWIDVYLRDASITDGWEVQLQDGREIQTMMTEKVHVWMTRPKDR